MVEKQTEQKYIEDLKKVEVENAILKSRVDRFIERMDEMQNQKLQAVLDLKESRDKMETYLSDEESGAFHTNDPLFENYVPTFKKNSSKLFKVYKHELDTLGTFIKDLLLDFNIELRKEKKELVDLKKDFEVIAEKVVKAKEVYL